MDMKKILQAMDGISTTKPVEGSNDMAKFLRLVKEADLNQPAALPAAPKFYITQTSYDSLGEPPDFSVTDLQRGVVVKSFSSEEEARAFVAQQDPAGAPQTELHQAQSNATAPEPQQISEGANPHKVSLPVQMAMQHYQEVKEVEPVARTESAFKKYFKLAEDEIKQQKEDRRAEINKYAKIIAERVRLKEAGEGKWHVSPSGVKTNMPPTDDDYEINYGADGAAAGSNEPDVVSVDIPLLIRLLEYAREDAQGDIDLHDITERMISLSSEGRTLTMDDYNDICNTGDQELPRPQDNQEA